MISISIADKYKRVIMGAFQKRIQKIVFIYTNTSFPGTFGNEGFAPTKIIEDEPTILATLTTNNKVYENTLFNEHMTIDMAFWFDEDKESPDLLYTTHPTDKIVNRFIYYPSGQFHFQKHVLEENLKVRSGYPTGVAVDTNGHVWIAIDTEGCVIEVDADKDEVLQTIHLEKLYLTGMEFGGVQLETLFVTTNTYDLFGNGQDSSENSAGIIAIEELGVNGFPKYFEGVSSISDFD